MNKDTNNNHGSDDPNLRANIWAFKAWFAKESDVNSQPPSREVESKNLHSDLIGSLVESRLGIERLEMQIEKHNADFAPLEIGILAKQFKNSGGRIVGTDALTLTVEVAKGKFAIPKLYTKPIK